MGNEVKAYYHLMSGIMLLVVCLFIFLLGLIILALWQAGLTVFIVVLSALSAFSWLTHRTALYAMKRDWF